MLVLSRQVDETIVIGEDIEITVVQIRGRKVRLGIDAPRGVSVHRKEIWEQIRREKCQGHDDRDSSGLAGCMEGARHATEIS
jgi:carbon storage regulator